MFRRWICALAALLVSFPAVPSGLSEEIDYILTDPAGDVGWTSAPGVPVPSTAESRIVDIREVRIREVDEERLEFWLRNEEGFTSVVDAGSFHLNTVMKHVIYFSLPGAGQVIQLVVVVTSSSHWLDSNGNLRQETAVGQPMICLAEAYERQPLACEGARIAPPSIRLEDKSAVFSILKKDLTQAGAASERLLPRLAPMLFKGDEIRIDRVLGAMTRGSQSSGGGEIDRLAVNIWQDELLATDSRPFALSYGSGNPDILVSWPQAIVVSGQETLLPVNITTTAVSPKHLTLTAETIDPPEGWSVNGTSRLRLEPESWTIIELRVRGGDVGSAAEIRLRLEVDGEPGMVAFARTTLSAVPLADESHSRFFIHGFKDNPQLLPGAPWFPGINFFKTYLSRSSEAFAGPDEPINEGGGVAFVGPGGAAYSTVQFVIDDAGIANLALVRERPVTFHLEFESSIPNTRPFRALLGTADGLAIEHTGDVEFVDGKTVLEFAKEWSGERELGPHTPPISFVFELAGSQPDGTVSGASSDTALIPLLSWIDIPLAGHPLADFEPATLNVVVVPKEALESFVNPGFRQVYAFDVRNDEPTPVRLEILLEHEPDEWKTEIHPTNRMHLDPGELTRLAIAVTAPKDSDEGERHEVLLTVRELDSSEVLRKFAIITTASSGVDVADESFATPENGAAEVREKATPAPSLVWFVVACIVAAGLWRRRPT